MYKEPSYIGTNRLSGGEGLMRLSHVKLYFKTRRENVGSQ